MDLKKSKPLLKLLSALCCSISPPPPLLSASLHPFHPSVSFLTFCLSTLLYFPPSRSHCFFMLFQSFCPLSKSPCHLSSLGSSIYICLFLPCPSLTSHSLSLCFPPVLFSLSLLLSPHLSPLSLSLFLANHYSFSFVSSDAAALFSLQAEPNPPNPRSLFFLIALFLWQGGAAGLAPHCCCRHTAGL